MKITGVVTAAFIGLSFQVHSQTWNMSEQWSIQNNPNGDWSYGRRVSVTGDFFNLHSYRYQNSFWLDALGAWDPSIMGGPTLLPSANELAVVRWTCPQTGGYEIETQFIGADSRGVDTVGYVIAGGEALFTGNIRADRQVVDNNMTLVLQQGDYVDFAVAWGGNQPLADKNWTRVQAIITVDPDFVPLEITRQPADKQVPVGGDVTFSVEVEGVPPFEYQWFYNGVELSGENSEELFLESVRLRDQGEYHVEVVDQHSSLVSEKATLAVSEFVIGLFTAIELEFPTEQNTVYKIEWSANLIDWTSYGEPIQGSGELFNVFISTRNSEMKYFRVSTVE